jgi:hypothetical protein
MEAQLAILRISVGFGSKLAVELRVEPANVGSKDLCNERWDIVAKGKKNEGYDPWSRPVSFSSCTPKFGFNFFC